jgi:hypothetical protein
VAVVADPQHRGLLAAIASRDQREICDLLLPNARTWISADVDGQAATVAALCDQLRTADLSRMRVFEGYSRTVVRIPGAQAHAGAAMTVSALWHLGRITDLRCYLDGPA